MASRRPKASFSNRLILLMLLATVPAMLGAIWLLSRKTTDDLRSVAAQELASTAHHLAGRVETWVDETASDLQLLSRHPDLTSMDPSRQRALLQLLCKTYPRIAYAHTDRARRHRHRPL